MEFRKEELKMREKNGKTKFDRELDMRKDEVEIRKEELKLWEKEIAIKKQEMENKSEELEILFEKTKGDNENQKRITSLLMTLINHRCN